MSKNVFFSNLWWYIFSLTYKAVLWQVFSCKFFFSRLKSVCRILHHPYPSPRPHHHHLKSQMVDFLEFGSSHEKFHDWSRPLSRKQYYFVLSSTNWKKVQSPTSSCKLCAWVIFIILLTRLLCGDSNSLRYEPRKGAKSNTFTCQLCDCTSHVDWLFTVRIVTWTWRPV